MEEDGTRVAVGSILLLMTALGCAGLVTLMV